MRKNQFNQSGFAPSRRRMRLPIVPILLLVAVVGLVAVLWSRGGEQPQQRVEKPIAAERLGK